MRRPLQPMLAPLFLRVALGVTFLWAGLAKIEGTMPASGANAASLATMGLDSVRAGAVALPTPPPSPDPERPRDVLPSDAPPGESPNDASNAPAATTSDTPSPSEPTAQLPAGPHPADAPHTAPSNSAPAPSTQPTTQPTTQPITPPTTPLINTSQPASPSPATQPTTEAVPGLPVPAEKKPNADVPGADSGAAKPALVPGEPVPDPLKASRPRTPETVIHDAAHVYTAEEFPKEQRVKALYGIALLVKHAGEQTQGPQGAPTRRLWPASLTGGSWPLVWAWSVALAEIIAGACVLLGLFTRASAIALVCVMLCAMWLTEVGPALRSGEVMLGILPRREWLALDQWRTFLWQFALLFSSGALAALGSGALGLDRRLFPPPPPPPDKVRVFA